ncbi:hypothetical protein BJX63DRAFT_387174 [Aspergillus granulosus]|uniref:Uncharacterized protein n=1 Tax=Aspergillus granulosus TaxID=176169 RepID=A0ABR4HMX7_9EURO
MSCFAPHMGLPQGLFNVSHRQVVPGNTRIIHEMPEADNETGLPFRGCLSTQTGKVLLSSLPSRRAWRCMMILTISGMMSLLSWAELLSTLAMRLRCGRENS